jgi:glucokinase
VILAGDIGGTNARIAFFEVEQRRLKRVYEHLYPTREHPNLESAVATFIDHTASSRSRHASVSRAR